MHLVFSDTQLSMHGMLEDTIIDHGTTLYLICPIYIGDDQPVITEWYKDSKLIKLGYDLRLTTSSHRDSGVYHCVVILYGNRVMSNSATVTVKGNVAYFDIVVIS